MYLFLKQTGLRIDVKMGCNKGMCVRYKVEM